MSKMGVEKGLVAVQGVVNLTKGYPLQKEHEIRTRTGCMLRGLTLRCQ